MKKVHKITALNLRGVDWPESISFKFIRSIFALIPKSSLEIGGQVALDAQDEDAQDEGRSALHEQEAKGWGFTFWVA